MPGWPSVKRSRRRTLTIRAAGNTTEILTTEETLASIIVIEAAVEVILEIEIGLVIGIVTTEGRRGHY